MGLAIAFRKRKRQVPKEKRKKRKLKSQCVWMDRKGENEVHHDEGMNIKIEAGIDSVSLYPKNEDGGSLLLF